MSSRSSIAVLVVEDEPVFRRLLRHTLQHAGYQVMTAADGEEAWQCLSEHSIDVLVTDHQMPRCSGVELLERMASHACGGHSLVEHAVLCTGKGYELDHAELKSQFGLLAVMGKPFSPRKLIRCLDDVFAAETVSSDGAFSSEMTSWGEWAEKSKSNSEDWVALEQASFR